MIRKFTLFILFGLAGLTLRAQVITCSPAFPTANDSVTITFNAALGDKGMANYTGTDVYAYTGVLTNLSTSTSGWRYVKESAWLDNPADCKMTKVGTNLWQLKIKPSIRAFYGVPSSERITSMAFVFRNSTGSVSGRDVGSKDIFYSVYQFGLNVKISTPTFTSPAIVKLNDTVHIAWSSSSADSTFLMIDNKTIVAATGSTFTKTITATSYGKHMIMARADSASKKVYDSAYYYVLGPNKVEALPSGIRDGINYINDTTVTLCLYAPSKNHVFVLGDFNNWEVDSAYQMRETSDNNRYWLTITHLTPKKQYIFQYDIDDTIRVGDPYADQVSDPWNDQYITSATYPNLIAYPQGKTSGIASVLETGQTPYPWKITSFNPPKEQNLVIYELWVGDFTSGHTFNDVIDTLGYLKRLGINAIELMPVSEFEGNISWGYNPNYYFAVDKYYGPKNTYKALIDSCHANGIAVIMDVVLNHQYNTSPFAMMYWDAANNRPAANNPWFNQTSPNTTFSYGNDFNYDSPQTVKLMDSVCNYWLTEYKVDGFRFDFAKGFTNTPGEGTPYDTSRIRHLEHMYDHIKEFHPKAYDILELFTANSEEKVLTSYGMSVWGNENSQYNQATMGYVNNPTSDFSGISYKQNGFTNPAGIVGYMESHDEERLMYKNETYGASSGNYNVKDIPTALKRMEEAGAFFFTVPGPKMIWMFGELGYDYSINTCTSGTIDATGGCRTDLKPIRWDYYSNDVNRRHLYTVWSALIHLKETQPVFQTSSFTMKVGATSLLKSIQLSDTSMDVDIIGNFDVVAGDITPSFQKTGWWYDYFSGDSINVSDVNATINLQPGEYHIYTTKKLTAPDLVLGTQQHTLNNGLSEFQVYPNPAFGNIQLNVNMQSATSGEISLYDLTGRMIKTFYNGRFNQGVNTFDFNVNGIGQGLYFVVVNTENNRQVKKLMIQ